MASDSNGSKAWLLELIPLAVMGLRRLFNRKHEWYTIETVEDRDSRITIHVQRCDLHKHHRMIKVKDKDIK